MEQDVKQVLQILVSKEPEIANGFYLVEGVGLFVYTSPDYGTDGLLLIIAEGGDQISIQKALAEFAIAKPKQPSPVSTSDYQVMLRTLVGLSRKFASGLIEVNLQIKELITLARPEHGGSGVPLPLEMFGMNSDETDPEEDY